MDNQELQFTIDGHTIFTTSKTLDLPGEATVIGFYFDRFGNTRQVHRNSIYGELLHKAAIGKMAA